MILSSKEEEQEKADIKKSEIYQFTNLGHLLEFSGK
jgi:hypothetical protein